MMNEQESREMMEDDDRWPLWPRLPLARWAAPREMELGFMVAGSPLRVYLGNVFPYRVVTSYMSYKTLDELLEDGWRVN